MGVLENKKHEMFCQEYLIDLNATQAYIRVYGAKATSAATNGNELLRNTEIDSRIKELLADRSKRTGINADRVIRELARVAFVNPLELIDTENATIKKGVTDDDKAAILSVKVKKIPTKNGEGVEREIKLCDKLKAMELLGKHLGMYTDKQEISGPNGSPIQTQAVDFDPATLSDEELAKVKEAVDIMKGKK